MLYKLYKLKLTLQFIKFAFVGVVATLIDFITFVTFYKVFHLQYLICVIISFFIATLANWYLGRTIAFKDKINISLYKEGLYIYFVSGICLLIHFLTTFCVVAVFGLSPVVGKVIASFVGMFWSFAGRKLFIYTK